MPKGYPKSRFEIVNQTQIQSIDTASVSNPTALYMQPYTSNKGTEDWELLTSFDGFTDAKGAISFNRHGQAQLTVAQALRSGAYVLGKRMVSDDAALANTTVMARLLMHDDATYVYYYTKSVVNCTGFDEACEKGYGDFDPDKIDLTVSDSVDIPLFTVTPMGRGESLLFFRISPIKVSSRKKSNSSHMTYSFEVIEDNEVIESIVISMNPEIVVDDMAQGMNPKIRNNSNQVRVKSYEDGIYTLVTLLANKAVFTDSNGKTTNILPVDLINMDYINGFDRSGSIAIGGIVTEHTAEKTTTETTDENGKPITVTTSLWEDYKPEDIEVVYDLASDTGIPLVNGSFGTMGADPMSNPEELEKLLLSVFGAKKDPYGEYPDIFDSIIYDLDAYKIDAIFDCNWPRSVKNAIVDMIDFRGDMIFLCDLGTSANTVSTIREFISGDIDKDNGLSNSNYMALYHNYFKILDPFSKKEITVTMPYLLVDKLTNHISRGTGLPFAGIANNIYFNNIIENTVNFYPVEIPGVNQKQELIDMNVNYLSLYDGVPVMETMYVNDTEYSQLSYLHNIMAVQEIIKTVRTRCPRTRYTFLDGTDLENYISDVQAIIKEYSTNFKSISCEYMADEVYEQNNIFYAVLKVQFKNFIQEEYFKIIAIS